MRISPACERGGNENVTAGVADSTFFRRGEVALDLHRRCRQAEVVFDIDQVCRVVAREARVQKVVCSPSPQASRVLRVKDMQASPRRCTRGSPRRSCWRRSVLASAAYPRRKNTARSWRATDAHMNFLRARPAHHATILRLVVPRTMESSIKMTRLPSTVAHRVQLEPHAKVAHALFRLDKRPAHIVIANQAERKGIRSLRVSERRGHAGVRHWHDDIGVRRSFARELAAHASRLSAPSGRR